MNRSRCWWIWSTCPSIVLPSIESAARRAARFAVSTGQVASAERVVVAIPGSALGSATVVGVGGVGLRATANQIIAPTARAQAMSQSEVERVMVRAVYQTY